MIVVCYMQVSKAERTTDVPTTPQSSVLSSPLSSPSFASPLGSPINPCSPEDSDDTASIVSSASAMARKEFKIPDVWRPTIMTCIRADGTDEQKKMLTASIRNELVRDLVTQMYTVRLKPDRSFCTLVAKSLVKKYPFMKDAGDNVSGYVSISMALSMHDHAIHYYTSCVLVFHALWYTGLIKVLERVI